MSKRHRKTKMLLSSESGPGDIDPRFADYDLAMYEAPKGKKPKGRHKRETHKRAYYDD